MKKIILKQSNTEKIEEALKASRGSRVTARIFDAERICKEATEVVDTLYTKVPSCTRKELAGLRFVLSAAKILPSAYVAAAHSRRAQADWVAIEVGKDGKTCYITGCGRESYLSRHGEQTPAKFAGCDSFVIAFANRYYQGKRN